MGTRFLYLLKVFFIVCCVNNYILLVKITVEAKILFCNCLVEN